MRGSGRIITAGLSCCLAVLAATWISPVPSAQGQDKRSSKKTSKGGKSKPLGNTKNLDIKADQLQSAFTRDAEELAAQYAEAGHLDRAKAILESALAVNPQSASLQKKLDQVKEGVMNANDFTADVNPARGWEPSGVMVYENRPLRIKCEGNYKFDIGSGSVTAAGFPQKNPAQDVIPNIACGALIGMIVGDGKQSRPFFVGESLDFTPRETGMLHLRVNAPAGNKNSGKLKVSISGYVQAP